MAIIEETVLGIYDSIKVFKFLLDIYKEEKEAMNKSKSIPEENDKEKKPTIIGQVWRCIATNFLLSVFPIFLFIFVLCPVIRNMLNFLHSEAWATYLWSWTDIFLKHSFHLLWMYPLFVLGRVINLVWYQDIADSIFVMRNGRPKHINYALLIADLIINFFTQLAFLAQCWFLTLQCFPNPLYYISLYMPSDAYRNFFMSCVKAVHYSMLYSLYGFEYKWFNLRITLDERIRMMEEKWPYYLGFGLPFYFITDYWDLPFLRSGLFAVLFPLFILSCQAANRPRTKCMVPFRIFTPTLWIIMQIFARNTRFTPGVVHSKRMEVIGAVPLEKTRTQQRSTPRLTPPPQTTTPDHIRHRTDHRSSRRPIAE